MRPPTATRRVALALAAPCLAIAWVVAPNHAHAYDHVVIEVPAPPVDADTARGVGLSATVGFPVALELGLTVHPIPWLSLETTAGLGTTGFDFPLAGVFGGGAALRIPLADAHHLLVSASAAWAALKSLSCDGAGECGPESALLLDVSVGWAWLADDLEWRVAGGAIYTRPLDADPLRVPVAPALSLGLAWWPFWEAPE